MGAPQPRPAAPELPTGDVAAWCAALLVTQGEGIGDRLTLWPWERDVLRRLGKLPGGELGLTVAAGAGKTTVAAAICAAGVAGPMAQPARAVVGVAGSFTQALILAEHVQAFLAPLTAADLDRRRVLRSNSALVEDRQTGASFRAREASARTLHGSAPSRYPLPARKAAGVPAVRGRQAAGGPGTLVFHGCCPVPASSTLPTRTPTLAGCWP